MLDDGLYSWHGAIGAPPMFWLEYRRLRAAPGTYPHGAWRHCQV